MSGDRRGASVTGGDVNGAGLDAVAAELGEAFVRVPCDVTRRSDVAALVATAVARFGASNGAGEVVGDGSGGS
jgi:NADP-dependent 3-hydroxy acid dehydrogenase YdfG